MITSDFILPPSLLLPLGEPADAAEARGPAEAPGTPVPAAQLTWPLLTTISIIM